MQLLFIDIETYSTRPIKDTGAYVYMNCPDFEILVLCYAVDNGPVQTVPLAEGYQMPAEFTRLFNSPDAIKVAHNAAFERLAFRRIGMERPPEEWFCTSVQAAYCGLPLSLDGAGKALQIENLKLGSGKQLIKYFCEPCKPTKANGMRSRNYHIHAPEKWADFKEYCRCDVLAMREIYNRLAAYGPDTNTLYDYELDQRINDNGVTIDRELAAKAVAFNAEYTDDIKARLQDLTGLRNPNSTPQLKDWLYETTGRRFDSLAKDKIKPILEELGRGVAAEALKLKQRLGKTSTAKYEKMLSCSSDDGRARGLLQFYGANRTGRWAGRLVQVQNLPRQNRADLEEAREDVVGMGYDMFSMLYDKTATILSELVRTALTAAKGHYLCVADFSAIEARVLAWLAGETWRLEVFETHGKIYEASAAAMFNVPFESITKDSELRQRGKVAELALGYQGGVGAVRQMDIGGKLAGLSDEAVKAIVDKWRAASPNICKFWRALEAKALQAARAPGRTVATGFKNITFRSDGKALICRLPSGRELFYRNPKITANKWGRPALTYKGIDQTAKRWAVLDTYGGKLCENITQAVARDLLAHALRLLDADGYKIIMHVHDEVVLECKDKQPGDLKAPEKDMVLQGVCKTMCINPEWAHGLPLAAAGFVTYHYKK